MVILANQQTESRLSVRATSMGDQSSLYVTRITLYWGLMLYIVKLIGVGVPLFHAAQVGAMGKCGFPLPLINKFYLRVLRRVNEIQPIYMYEVSGVNVNVDRSSTFTFRPNLSYIAS